MWISFVNQRDKNRPNLEISVISADKDPFREIFKYNGEYRVPKKIFYLFIV